VGIRLGAERGASGKEGRNMKTIVGGLVVVLAVGLVLAPAYGQQHAPKGTEGPDIRKVEPKGTEGPEVRKQQPKRIEGPDVRKKKTVASSAPKPMGTEGPEERKQAPKGIEGPDVRKKNP
jgi:hypothetical protein